MSQFYLATLVSMLLISLLHWFPWKALLHRDLHRLEAYAAGLFAILAPSLTVLWSRGDYDAIIIILACTIAAGVATITAKSIDKIIDYRNEIHDRRNRD